MKQIRMLAWAMLAVLCCSAFTMKSKEKPVYVFGVAASFNDTIVYYTEIQLLDSVFLDKDGFLPERETYSYQLKNYLQYDLQKENYTCMIYFSENKSKLEKEAMKLKNRYGKAKDVTLEAVKPSDFMFKKPEE